MARRDHTLDDKITAAAREEFSSKGYMGASLRKIAEKAEVTVGAIQIRYKSKDDLFLSLLRPLLEDIEATFRSVRDDYYDFKADDSFLSQLKASMQHESAAILHLIFRHYEEAFLLFYRSAGSSVEHYFDRVVDSKIEQSVLFFRRAGYEGIDEGLLGMLISVQFDSYRRLVAAHTSREQAEHSMNTLMIYHYAGWCALFDSANSTQEDGSI